jgi:hypothetical protein
MGLIYILKYKILTQKDTLLQSTAINPRVSVPMEVTSIHVQIFNEFVFIENSFSCIICTT